ncbi:hypothetical protein [Tropicimonas sp. IMCC34011]|uniref:hypothetical protein n=1 Tax=Tropicimonas sp. IMCC34011 TaxID=2248759 RepID=UPI000E27B8F8|nr:hypothetical protein [Tropicimonas sp. IMCC34011]
MVATSKILTVSYGTFSCTLEGFDDSFGTMKAISEYFRDLAADDRYFGAEPPTPDAEMLQRIVEKEIHSRVEARMSERGLLLRPSDAPEDDSEEEAPETASEESATSGEPVSDPVAASSTDPEPEPEPESETEPLPELSEQPADAPRMVRRDAPLPHSQDRRDTIPESVAAKLARIRSVVGTSRPMTAGPIVDTASYEDEGPDQPLPTEPGQSPAAIAAMPGGWTIAETADEAAEEPENEAWGDPVEEAEETEPSSTAAEQMGSSPDAADPEDAWTIYGEDDPTGETPAYDADEPSAEAVAETEPTAAESAEPHEDELPTADHEASTAGETEDLADAVEAASPEAGAPIEADSEHDAARTEDADAAEGPVIPRRPRLIRMKRRAREASLAALQEAAKIVEEEKALDAPKEADPQASAPAEPPASEPPAAPEPAKPATGGLSDEEEAELLRELAALEFDDEAPSPEDQATKNEGSAAFESTADDADDASDEDAERALAIALGDWVEEDETEAEPSAASPEPAAVEEGEDEDRSDAELARMLAGIGVSTTATESVGDSEPARAVDARAETDATAEDSEEEEVEAADPASGEESGAEDDEDDAPDTRKEAAAERRARALPDAEDEGRVSRLMDDADSRLAGPELRRRRDAIAHLKAAVAAARADELGPRENEAEVARPYRDDLADIVRTRSGHGDESGQQETDDAAPELGGSSDGDDLTTDSRDGPATGGPVRPRRPARGGRQAHRTAREAAPGPSPLILVSEQRVDRPSEPVRPRRVAGQLDIAPEETSESVGGAEVEASFVEFAERMETRGLEDLLECAAAYCSTVEGRQHISHPEVMKRVRSLAGHEDLSREESLRSFGLLLRQGRLVKLGPGRFAVDQSSRYARVSHSMAGQ